MSSTDTSNGTPISGAVALVTGGNRGFGRALVDELLDRGAAKVYATSRSGHPQRDDDRIVPLILDVTDDTSVAAAAQKATDVSILVNNAGINLRTPVLEAPLSDIHDELETNLFGSSSSRAPSRRCSRGNPEARWSTCSRDCRGSRSAAAMRSPSRRDGPRRTRCASHFVTRARS